MKIKKILFFLFRLFITFFLLYLIYRKIDLKVVKELILTSNYYYYLIALAVFFVSNITGAAQWFCLLKSQKNSEIRLVPTIKLYLFSAFFNNFLPTNVGGDVVKVYRLIKMDYNKKIVFSSVLWDRFINIIILILFSLITGYIILKRGIILSGLFAFIFFLILALILIQRYNAGKFLLRIVRAIKNEKIKYFLEEFLISFKMYIQKSRYILYFYALSFITQFLKIYFMVFIALAMKIDIKIIEIFFISPIIGIVSSLPISINGLGIREYIGQYLFMYLNKERIVISLFISLGNIIIILANFIGIIFTFQKEKINLTLKRGAL